jgi:[acyl-carrier-protein] S-malonyltransferase
LTYEGRKFKDKIKWQLVSPVLWEDCVKEMISHKVDRFIEVGPQRVLTNLNRRIDNSKQVFNIDSLGAIDSFLSENEQPFTGTF